MKFTTEEYTEEEKKANGNMMKGGKLHDKICDYIQESYKLSDSQINDVSMGVWMAIQAKDEQIEILKFERVPVEIHEETTKKLRADILRMSTILQKLQRDLDRDEHVDGFWMKDLFPDAQEIEKRDKLIERYMSGDLSRACFFTRYEELVKGVL